MSSNQIQKGPKVNPFDLTPSAAVYFFATLSLAFYIASYLGAPLCPFLIFSDIQFMAGYHLRNVFLSTYGFHVLREYSELWIGFSFFLMSICFCYIERKYSTVYLFYNVLIYTTVVNLCTVGVSLLINWLLHDAIAKGQRNPFYIQSYGWFPLLLIYSCQLVWDSPRRWISVLCEPIKIPVAVLPFVIIGSAYFFYFQKTAMVVAGVLGLLWAVWGVEIKLPEIVYITTEKIVPNCIKNSDLYSRDMGRRRKVLFTEVEMVESEQNCDQNIPN